MTENQKYKLNAIMRTIIKEKYNGNNSALARAVNVTRQTIQSYYHNKRYLGWRMFSEIIDKSDYKARIEITKKTKEINGCNYSIEDLEKLRIAGEKGSNAAISMKDFIATNLVLGISADQSMQALKDIITPDKNNNKQELKEK